MADKKETKKKGTSGIAKYFKDVRGELKKVVWPSFKQVKNNTIIVIVVVILVGILIWALDFGFQSLVGLVLDKTTTQTEAIDYSDLTVGEDGTVNMDGVQLVDENGNPIDADVVTEGAEAPAEGEEAAAEEGAAAETEAEAETTDETAGADE